MVPRTRGGVAGVWGSGARGGAGGARMGWGGRAEPGQYQWHWQGTGRNIGAHHTPLFTGSAVPCRTVPALALGKPASTLNCACGRCQGKGVGPGPLLVPSLEGGVEVCVTGTVTGTLAEQDACESVEWQGPRSR